MATSSGALARVLVVGAGFAGFHAARCLSRRWSGVAEVVVINSTDYFLYLPLLPEVAAGVLDPRRVSVSLTATLPGVRLLLGDVDVVDLDERRVGYTDPEGTRHDVGYDRLVVAVGSVNKLLPIPGVATYAHGFRDIAEALYLRDHITRQVELAAATDNPEQRAARCTFVVVGAGYTGTEVAAQGPLLTTDLSAGNRQLAGLPMRWLLLDLAKRVLPDLDPRLSATAERVLRERGVQVLTGTSVDEATAEGVRLSTGEFVATRSLIWCVGVRPDPLVEQLGLPLERGRIAVDTKLRVADHPDVFACGDAAAVPDVTRPGQLTAMTAQHAMRQGKLAARNVAASLGHGHIAAYRHRDLGFLVDLGGRDAAANPLNVALSGTAAKAVTRAYHLAAMPGNRIRTAVDWALDALLPRQRVHLGLVQAPAVPLDTSRSLRAVD
jgi:NADH:quinone reductase (non-electrogenic)